MAVASEQSGPAGKPKVQILGINNIRLDNRLQGRVTLNVDHMRHFSELFSIGADPHPVDVVFDGKNYWLTDGFHRVKASLNARLKTIKAVVTHGSFDEAVLAAACANKVSILPRSDLDKEKQLAMLFGIAGWLDKSVPFIAKATGIGATFIRKARLAYCQSHGVAMPEKFLNINGRLTQTARGRDGIKKSLAAHGVMPSIFKSGGGYFQASVDGRIVSLGKTREQAEIRLDSLVKEAVSKREEKLRSLSTSSLTERFRVRGLSFTGITAHSEGGLKLGGYHGHGVVFVISKDLSRHEHVALALGRVLITREASCPGLETIVLGYPKGDALNAIEFAERIGVRFMSPDQLAEYLAAKEAKHSE